MEFAAYKTDFDHDGFVVVPKFLTCDGFAGLTGELDRYIREVVPTLPDSDAFYQDRSRAETLTQMQHMESDPFFEGYRRHPRWTALAEALLNEPVDPQAPEWFNKPPGTTRPTPPHQDNYYFNLQPPNTVSLWLALDSVDEENGCLRFVPGSHQQGLIPRADDHPRIIQAEIEDPTIAVDAPGPAGSRVVFSCYTAHHSFPNRTDTGRRAILYTYNPVSDGDTYSIYKGQHTQRCRAWLAAQQSG